MSILVCGANGQVGNELARLAGAAAVALDRGALDITRPASVDAVFRQHRPFVVINAAAYTAVDKAETEIDAAFAINRDGPANLARACAEAGAVLLHISTDYVFDGGKRSPYRETDPVNPLGVYARSKCEGEQRIRELCTKHIILRTSWVFGAHGNNFVRTILRLARERPELRIVGDQRGGPTHSKEIAASLLMLARRIVAGESLKWGTYHFGGAPETTWHGFATAIVDEAHALGMLEKKPVIHSITTADYPLPAKRPANSVFDMSASGADLGLKAPAWRDGLKEVLQTWAST